ncbi:hypothetical protein Pmani_038122 [Petrolisthes manimaculis]|uniref:Bromo domain-containing protein n=1 Tax=Petrolisthes manimaculis TaxID=1843537 RepID=A0AAE1NF63_9EUCA|nr:hypothetical protein Pmani_038122 [Petrolisthes manimaculis]
MADSPAERLKLKQYQVDTWTKREQLCLASAVMRSGDQNWVAVRRNIKMLTTETSRPQDWYSTKNCALQYTKLLEQVDTPKRKRERGDTANQTPGEIVTKMLSKQRVEELRVVESEEKASYTTLRKEIQELESGLCDHKLDDLWDQLVKEQAEEEEEQKRHQQWLKEREEKITAIQQALKHQGPKVTMPPHKKKHKSHNSGSSVGVGQGTSTTTTTASRRNSGVSETSSEVDSTVDSPDVNDTTSQDEGGVSGVSGVGVSGGDSSEVKPSTPSSPLLTTLLNKSPHTTPSPLSQRGVGISPVSEALQNLVTSAISGIDKHTTNTTTTLLQHNTSTTSSSIASGSSTLSRLLDLPPSIPGGPLPRLTDLPGPSTQQQQHREQDNKSEALKKCGKESECCGDGRGCSTDHVNKHCTSKTEDKHTHTSEAAAGEKSNESKQTKEHETKVTLQQGKQGTTKEEEEEEAAEKFKKPENIEEAKPDLKEENISDATDTKQHDPTTTTTTTEIKSDDNNTKTKQQSDETTSVQKANRTTIQVDDNTVTTQQHTNNNNTNTKTTTTTTTTADDIKTEAEDRKNVISVGSSGGSGGSGGSGVKEEEEEDDGDDDDRGKEEEEEESDNNKQPKETHKKDDDDDDTKRKDDSDDMNNSSKEEEEEITVVGAVVKDLVASIDEKKIKKTYRRDPPDDDQDKEDSKGWGSEEESSSTSSRKRKISSGDLPFGCPSPLISESAPNSPASTHCGDDSESEKAYRSWKKPVMILWNDIAAHKFASLFLRPITDEKAPGYHSVVYRAMDLQKIKRNIESGLIRTTAEFQRDIMLMFLNATMYNTRDHNVYHMAHQMMKDAVSTIQDFLNTQMLARAEDTPQKSLRRETRESSAKRSDDDPKRKREPLDEKSIKKRRI